MSSLSFLSSLHKALTHASAASRVAKFCATKALASTTFPTIPKGFWEARKRAGDTITSRGKTLPTFKELRYDVPLGETLTGILAPPGLPEEIRKTLSDAMTKVFKDPEVIRMIEKIAAFSQYLSGPEFRTETESMYKFVKQNRDVYWGKK